MIHNRTPFLLCLAGGVLMVLSGASDTIGVLEELVEGLAELFGHGFVLTYNIVMGILGVLMILAGLLIVVSGFILTTARVEIGRILLIVSLAMGVAGLIASLAQALMVGDVFLDMDIQIAQSLGWLGAIFSVVARIIAEQKPMIPR